MQCPHLGLHLVGGNRAKGTTVGTVSKYGACYGASLRKMGRTSEITSTPHTLAPSVAKPRWAELRGSSCGSCTKVHLQNHVCRHQTEGPERPEPPHESSLDNKQINYVTKIKTPPQLLSLSGLSVVILPALPNTGALLGAPGRLGKIRNGINSNLST